MNVHRAVLVLVATGSMMGCAAGVEQTTFLHPEYDLSYVERIAVIPFENLSDDRGAGARVSRYFVSALLATESFDVVEPGEVARVLEPFGIVRTGELTQDRVVQIGKELGVQAVFLGSIAESSTVRSGSSSTSVVTLDVHLVETDTGVTVWSTTHSESGRSVWSTLFGTGQKSIAEVTRRCVERAIGSLVQ